MFDSFSQHYFAKYISRVTVGNMFVLYYSFLHSLIVETAGKYIKFCKRKKTVGHSRKRLGMTKTVGHYSMKTLGKNELLGSVVKLLTQQRAVPLSGIGRLHEPPYDGGSHAGRRPDSRRAR
jgi:hypothetical protein